ncbi:HTH-type transcriptional regulator SgrR [Photobacterium sp.]|uniref:HTH-type transcriptional regulator SgrR n=1 Tax=Photobacterium sp. TaxID=660 RepID=UPI00299E7460|nr:HTH-type transcriptional regulator SgrR [Photobacterium sp.]MDX1302109.1 HTH-type transcriptional regulator SgrR [Photobacterium sp.]
MTGQRLKLQFQRLYDHFSGAESETNLHDISEVLFCTRRNVRMVINKMVEKGWIDWQPAVGRGKQSRLIFHSTDSELQYLHARKLVAEGKLEPALAVLDNNGDKLAQLIQEQLGVTTLKGKQIVRIPYYRSFTNMNPLRPLRRSEQHLVRQIFSGLTRINEEKEEVEGDLAHHWESITPRHWRFYLRPAVRFHDGKLMESSDVVATLEQVKKHRLFKHLKSIQSPFPNTIDIYLCRDDVRLPDLMANILAMIQPADALSRNDIDMYPVGTGPYKVTLNDKQRLKLEAFDQYFGFRALIDMVDIWILAGFTACYLKPTTDINKLDPMNVSTRLKLDEGCNYLLFNRLTGLANNQEWLAYFHARLTPLNILRLLDHSKIGDFRLTNAYGLLPGWAHILPARAVDSAPAKRTVTLAYQQEHPVYPHLAATLREILAEDGLRLKILELSSSDILLGKYVDKIDIWLGGMSLSNYRSDAILPWFYSFDQLFRVMPKEEFDDLERQVMTWRADIEAVFPSDEIGASLVQNGQILPLFHNWLGADSSGSIEGMALNAMGWFDFKSLWMKPELKI